MKITTRTSSSLSVLNGKSSCALARNGKNIETMNARREATGVCPEENSRTRSPGHFCAGSNDALRREFLPVAAGRSKAGAGLPEPATSDSEIIFLYCVHGRGWCEIGGKRHELTPGQFLVAPAKLERTYSTFGEQAWSLMWMQLAEMNNSFTGKVIPTPQAATLGPREKAQIVSLFQEVLSALQLPCQQRLQQVSEKIMHLLDMAIPYQKEICHIETNAPGRIGRTIVYMKEHLNEPLRASTLAAVANMSLPHYFAQFKRIIGSSPIDYLIKLRMEHARRLLSETTWSVKEVAVSLGYDDPLYFSRVFKSVNQTAPSDFRARTRSARVG